MGQLLLVFLDRDLPAGVALVDAASFNKSEPVNQWSGTEHDYPAPPGKMNHPWEYRIECTTRFQSGSSVDRRTLAHGEFNSSPGRADGFGPYRSPGRLGHFIRAATGTAGCAELAWRQLVSGPAPIQQSSASFEVVPEQFLLEVDQAKVLVNNDQLAPDNPCEVPHVAGTPEKAR